MAELLGALNIDTVAKRNRIIDAYTKAYGYTTTIPDPSNPGQSIPNPETRQQAFRRLVVQHIKETARGLEVADVMEVARGTAPDDLTIT